MLEIVRIVAVHPEANSVDVVLTRKGSRIAGVQVLGAMAGADHGVSGLMQPAEQDKPTPADAQIDPSRVIYGVMAYAGGIPLLVGFLHPQVSQTLFTEKNRFLWRHPSDFYATVRDNADLELSHPSGTFLRVAAAPAHEDLTGRDYDGKFKEARNLGAAPWLSIAIANGRAAPHTTLKVDPSGNVSVEHAGNLDWKTHGNATIHVDGDATIQVDGDLSATVNGTAFAHVVGAVTLHADASLALQVAGTITSSAAAWNHTGPFSVTGAITASTSVTAPLVVGSTDVSFAGKSSLTHQHTPIDAGANRTGAPA